MELKCPECSASLMVPDGSAGRQTRCPRCSAVFTAEAAESSVETPSSATPGAADVNTSNPYAPTSASATIPSSQSTEWAPRQITYEEVFSKTWAIFKEQWLMTCAAILIVAAINVGLSLIQNIVVQILAATNADQAIVFVGQAGFTLLGRVVQIWLTIGQTMVMLDIARGRQVNLGKLFGGGPLVIKSALAMLLLWLALSGIGITLVGIPAAIGGLAMQDVGGAAIGAGIGLLIAVVPIIIVSLMLSQFQLLIVDRGLGPIESLRTSSEITSGNKLTLFVIGILLSVVAVLAMIAGLLALCVGIFPAMIGVGGFGALLLVVTYLCMTGQAVAAERTFVSPYPATSP
jgi:predicted Zn finger-like uncharacterized protein